MFKNRKTIEKVHNTAFGGFLSCLIIIIMIGILYIELVSTFKTTGIVAHMVNGIETATKPNLIGPIVIENESITPFISINYQGEDIFTDGTLSGQCSAHQGNCQKFVEEYLKITWQTVSGPNVTVSNSVVCTEKEILKRGNNLFLCPAAGMKFSNQSDNVTYDKI